MQAVRIRPNLHPKQKAIFGRDNAARMTLARCGRKFGKSRGTRAVILRSASQGHKTAYIAPEYSYLTDWVNEFVKLYYPAIIRYSKNDKEIHFHGGAVLDLWSLDNYDSIRPREYDLVVLDEVSLSPYYKEAWQSAIRPTLMKRKGRSYHCSTPKTNKGGPYFRELCEGSVGNPEVAHFHYSSYDNPHVPIEEIEAYKREVLSTVYRQEALAEFVDAEGALIRREWVRRGTLPEGLTFHLGVDLAISTKDSADYTAIVCVGVDKDKRIYVADVRRGQWSFIEQQRNIIAMAEQWRVASVAIEKVQYQAAMIQELRRTTDLVIRPVTPKGDKLFRAQPLAGKYEHGYVTHTPNLPAEFEKELLEFTGSGDDHDDMVDALVYATTGLERTLIYEL